MEEHVLDIKNLVKFYRGLGGLKKVLAVDQLSLSVKKGEVYGILGPNGSGKTTLMKLIMGLLFPSKGQIKIFGSSVKKLSIKKRIGFLPEEAYLYRFLSAEETLKFFAELADVPRREQKTRIADALHVVGLFEARKRPSRTYSKGMSRRLGLAQILIKDPDFVVLDEPTVGLDPIGSREIKEIILGLKEKGKTVLFSSHLLSEVEMVCDRIGIMHKGKLVLTGHLNDLLLRKNEYSLVLEGFDIGRQSELEHVLQESFHAKVISVNRSRETMEDVFIKTIKKHAS